MYILRKGLVTFEHLHVVNTILEEGYHDSMSILLCEISVIVLFQHVYMCTKIHVKTLVAKTKYF